MHRSMSIWIWIGSQGVFFPFGKIALMLPLCRSTELKPNLISL